MITYRYQSLCTQWMEHIIKYENDEPVQFMILESPSPFYTKQWVKIDSNINVSEDAVPITDIEAFAKIL